MFRDSFCCFVTAVVVYCAFTSDANAQLSTGWKQHDLKRPAPPVVTPGESNLPLKAPSDAIVLFDGKDLSKWRSANGEEATWKVVDGAMVSVKGGGFVYTKEEFGDCQLHVEWASPENVKGNSQGRGNSGVYLMGMFEVQVLDSYNNSTYADGHAGSIYGQFPPLVNASRKPGEWQSHDIIFKRPRFGGDDGETLVSPAMLTVLHNGVLVQNASEPVGPSEWLRPGKYKPGVTKASLGLQDHGNPVRYRNIWIRPLSDPARPAREEPYPQKHELSDEMTEAIVGDWGNFRIERSDDGLVLITKGRDLGLVPVSETEFVFTQTAGRLIFVKNEAGEIEDALLQVDAFGQSKSNKKE